MVEVEAEPAEDNDHREMEAIPEQIPPAEEEEMHFRMSPLSHTYLDMTENFPEQAESSRRGEGNTEIMEMLRKMKKNMEEREHKCVDPTRSTGRRVLPLNEKKNVKRKCGLSFEFWKIRPQGGTVLLWSRHLLLFLFLSGENQVRIKNPPMTPI